MGNGRRFFDKKSFVRLLEETRTQTPGAGTRGIPAAFAHSIEPDPATRDEHDDTELALGTGLLQDAARGDLPRVAWIDPNFVDLSILDPNSNDDHPPSDVRSGQELVMMVFRALAESPCWNETILIVTYDEHGGFYDHQAPDPTAGGGPAVRFIWCSRTGVRGVAPRRAGHRLSSHIRPHLDHSHDSRAVRHRWGGREDG
jgi:hypothetical protein